MKKNFFCILIFAVSMSPVFANIVGNDTGSAAGTNQETGMNINEVSDAVQSYLEGIFNRYLSSEHMRVTDLAITANWTGSTSDLVRVFVRANFRNFAIERRQLSGRLETVLAVRRVVTVESDQSGRWRRNGNRNGNETVTVTPFIAEEDNRDINITLYIGEHLSEGHLNNLIKNHLHRNFNNPLNINIQNSDNEFHFNRVYSRVTSVVNNNSIVFLRTVFEPEPPREQQRDIFTIIETNWRLNRADTLFQADFPAIYEFKECITGDIHGTMRDHHNRNYGRGRQVIDRTSEVRTIGRTNLENANGMMIKLSMDVRYRVDYSGGPGSYADYDVMINVMLEFDSDTRQWMFHNAQADTGNIRIVTQRRGWPFR